jgi:hypothetical protein
MVVRRASDNRIVVDTVISVTPGLDEYNLAAPVIIGSADEQFLVTLTAFQGDVELFSSPPIPTRATRVDAAGNPVGGAAAGAVSTTIARTYSDPGATATSVEIEPGQVVLGAGGGIMYEDPSNMDDLAAIVSEPGSCSGSGFQDIIADVPGLTDGVSSATDLGFNSLINNHICFADWADWLSPSLEIPASAGGPYTTGLYGTWGAGRIVLAGPDQDYHSESDGSLTEMNQFQLLINVLKWVGRLVG